MCPGLLELDSDSGRGARFFFKLCLPPGDMVVADTGGDDVSLRDWTRVERLSPGTSVRALVVDDIETNRDILDRILTKIGVEVDVVESGEAVLEWVRKEMPDIVFMDIRMPGLKGDEALKMLVEEHGSGATKVVAVTASVFEHQRKKYAKVGFDDFIDKPFRVEQIYACLAEHLNITYEYAEPVIEEVEVPDWDEVAVPMAIYEGLVSAVATHSITELRQHIDVLEGVGDNEAKLARYLRRLSQQFDLERIQSVLGELTVEEN